jgi:hypothetical protein
MLAVFISLHVLALLQSEEGAKAAETEAFSRKIVLLPFDDRI